MKIRTLFIAIAFAVIVSFSVGGLPSAHTHASDTGSPVHVQQFLSNTVVPGPCNNLPAPWVELDSSTNGSICVQGSGYHTLGRHNLPNTFFLSAQGSGGWIRYYNPGGHFCNFNAGNYFLQHVYITQVDIGGTQPGAPRCY